jgi:hypothetical protein
VPRAFVLSVLAALAACLAAVPAARAGDIVVVAHPDLPVDTLSVEDLRRIYVGEETFVGDVKLQPIDYTHQGPVAEAFLGAVVGMDAPHFHAWWVKEVFHGGGLPPRMAADVADVLRLVATEPGSVGYVPAASLVGVTSVKRVQTLHLP